MAPVCGECGPNEFKHHGEYGVKLYRCGGNAREPDGQCTPLDGVDDSDQAHAAEYGLSPTSISTMYASGSSPPPPDLEAPISATNSAPDTPAPIPVNNGGNDQQPSSTPATTAPSRKRKRGQAASTAHAASLAPSDPGSATGKDSAECVFPAKSIQPLG